MMTDPMVAIFGALEEEYNRVAGTEGWAYRPFPSMSVDAFEKICDIIGDDNLKIMAMRDFPANGIRLVGGDVLISPEGMERLKVRNES